VTLPARGQRLAPARGVILDILAPMHTYPLVPKGDALRHAVSWLAEQGHWTPQLIEEACQRFDVDPADEEFLLRTWQAMQDPQLRQA
jgi:hypothetical protein